MLVIRSDLCDSLKGRAGEESRKIESAAWGEGVVDELAAHIARTHPEMLGYTRVNLFRMRQFYETYRGDEKVSALLRQLPWTHNHWQAWTNITSNNFKVRPRPASLVQPNRGGYNRPQEGLCRCGLSIVDLGLRIS